MKDDILKIMIFHKNKTVRKTVKNELLKVVPHTLFITASCKGSFYEKIDWLTPDLILSAASYQDAVSSEVLLYARKNLEAIPFIFLINQFQQRNDFLSSLLKEGDKTINYDKPNLIAQTMHSLLPIVKKHKQSVRTEQFELYKQLRLAQKAIALSTKGYLTDKKESYLKSLVKI